jgi:Ca2+-binding EF-hand superfamily protein
MEDQVYQQKNAFLNQNIARSFNEIMDIVSRDISIFMSIAKMNYYELYLMINKSGTAKYISRLELKNWLRQNISVKLNKQELNEVIVHFDKNNDGQISLDEFHDKIK